RTNHSDVIAWGGRNGRQAWWGNGNYVEFELAVAPGPLVLRLLYWGEEIDKHFEILVEGRSIATERRPGRAVQAFVPVDYPLPADAVDGRRSISIRIETRGSDAPVYECRVLEV